MMTMMIMITVTPIMMVEITMTRPTWIWPSPRGTSRRSVTKTDWVNTLATKMPLKPRDAVTLESAIKLKRVVKMAEDTSEMHPQRNIY